jgi:hypothetical protein
MSEKSPTPEQPDQTPLSKRQLDWHRSEEEIRAISEEERLELLVEQAEQISRLYNAVTAMAGESPGIVTKRDVDLILNPEKQKYFYDLDRLTESEPEG